MVGAHVVYVSTDYVFDGTSDSALPGVGHTGPGVGVRRLQAGGRARVPARVHHCADELGVRRTRRQHGRHRAAPGRQRRRRAALRRRPARVADLHRRPGARHRDPRSRPAARDLPRHQQRRHHVVGFRAGGAGRGRRRSRAGAPDQHGRARSAPPCAPPGELCARQHGAAPERPARPACLGGRPGPPGSPPSGRCRRHEPLDQRPDGPALGGRHRRRLRGAAHRGDAGALRPPRRPGRTRCRPSCRRCARAACRSSRPDSTSWWPAASRPATSRSPTLPSTRWQGRSSSSCACRRPRAPTARPTCRTSRRRPRRSRRISMPGAIVVNKSTVPVGSANMVEQVIGRARHRRRLEPGVPP